ncbi:glycosyltransferase [Neosynechococcus sphagnicola sy1]|uniref:Glycosyltransferase n=1 Tax=Neosynechococcus sphagnicola sy1 TaxID=1497020 RepID=A0A098TR69_9CYAN|nr:glycosyltransferase [Neosynechococcus sphagnicola]KGF73298.1 glycosyltransferase [Neosynechococcus sphagnicola sy1]
MTLSLCMIVKDEAQNLPHCLASVRAVVDEMVVLDTGSRDGTPEIAQAQGARVYDFAWGDDFAAARNAALKYVQGDWVLVLDADEVLLPEIIPALKKVIQHPHYLLVNLLRQEVGAGQSPYSLVPRLFRHHPAVHFSRPYHESVEESIAQMRQREPQWQLRYLPQVSILHSGYQPTAIAARNKLNRGRSIMEAYLATHPGDAYLCSKLGALYVQSGALKRGITLLKQGLEAAPTEAATIYELHYHLGIAYTQYPHPEQATAHYQAALQQGIPAHLKLGAYNNWGSLLKDQGDLTAAQTAFEAALEIDPGFAIGHNNLGLTLKALGNLPAAIAHYQEAIRLKPDYAEAHQNLAVILLKLGQVADSLAAFRQAIALHQQQGSPEAERLRQGITSMGLPL